MATSVWQLYTPPPPERARDRTGERRRDQRRSIAVSGASVQDGGGTVAATLLDLSIYGCRLAVGEWHDEGDRLWLRFDGGWPIAASVVWTDGERIGCRFDAPISHSLMREVTRALF